MKRIFFFLVVISGYANAQMAVVNPTADAKDILKLNESRAQTAQAIAQTKALKAQINELKKSKEFVQKVNSRVKTVYYISEIERVLSSTVKMSSSNFKRLKESNQFSINELSIIMSNFGRVVMASNNVVALGNLVIQNNGLNMDDFQRLESLNRTHKDLLALNRELRILNGQYMYMAQKRAYYKAFTKK